MCIRMEVAATGKISGLTRKVVLHNRACLRCILGEGMADDDIAGNVTLPNQERPRPECLRTAPIETRPAMFSSSTCSVLYALSVHVPSDFAPLHSSPGLQCSLSLITLCHMLCNLFLCRNFYITPAGAGQSFLAHFAAAFGGSAFDEERMIGSNELEASAVASVIIAIWRIR
ncbi:hypothetical protein J6590_012436 [Homalodisca vitripennis]|nr:hypothetical protein J6590_012436 [Homalodisca vitripennis]